jgi:hypothetical protein
VPPLSSGCVICQVRETDSGSQNLEEHANHRKTCASESPEHRIHVPLQRIRFISIGSGFFFWIADGPICYFLSHECVKYKSSPGMLRPAWRE